MQICGKREREKLKTEFDMKKIWHNTDIKPALNKIQ